MLDFCIYIRKSSNTFLSLQFIFIFLYVSIEHFWMPFWYLLKHSVCLFSSNLLICELPFFFMIGKKSFHSCNKYFFKHYVIHFMPCFIPFNVHNSHQSLAIFVINIFLFVFLSRQIVFLPFLFTFGVCIKLFLKYFIWFLSFIELSLQFSSVVQSCPTLCDPMNCSTPGLPVWEGNGNPFQYFCLETPMDGGAW